MSRRGKTEPKFYSKKASMDVFSHKFNLTLSRGAPPLPRSTSKDLNRTPTSKGMFARKYLAALSQHMVAPAPKSKKSRIYYTRPTLPKNKESHQLKIKPVAYHQKKVNSLQSSIKQKMRFLGNGVSPSATTSSSFKNSNPGFRWLLNKSFKF